MTYLACKTVLLIPKQVKFLYLHLKTCQDQDLKTEIVSNMIIMANRSTIFFCNDHFLIIDLMQFVTDGSSAEFRMKCAGLLVDILSYPGKISSHNLRPAATLNSIEWRLKNDAETRLAYVKLGLCLIETCETTCDVVNEYLSRWISVLESNDGHLLVLTIFEFLQFSKIEYFESKMIFKDYIVNPANSLLPNHVSFIKKMKINCKLCEPSIILSSKIPWNLKTNLFCKSITFPNKANPQQIELINTIVTEILLGDYVMTSQPENNIGYEWSLYQIAVCMHSQGRGFNASAIFAFLGQSVHVLF